MTNGRPYNRTTVQLYKYTQYVHLYTRIKASGGAGAGGGEAEQPAKCDKVTCRLIGVLMC